MGRFLLRARLLPCCLAVAILAAMPSAARDYLVVPGSMNNTIHLDIETPAAGDGWSLAAELLDGPVWLTQATVAQPAPGTTEVRVSFDVEAAAPIMARGALVLRIEARDEAGRRAASVHRLVPLQVAPEAPGQQQSYRIEECCLPSAGIDADERGLPRQNGLIGAAPNPWLRETAIRLALANGGEVNLRILDITGRVVHRERTPRLEAGCHQIRWDGTDVEGRPVTPGIYFYEVSTGRWSAAGRMLRLIRQE